MALIKCPECGKEISSFAKACPNCGFPVNDSSQGLEIVDGVLKSLGNCKDKNIIVPYGVTEIEAWAFCHETYNGPFDPPDCCGDEFESIVIPNSVKKIGDYAFCACRSLDKLIIPDSVTEIGKFECDYNGSPNNIREIQIGRGLKYIPEGVFCDCISLKKITVHENTFIEPYGNFYGEPEDYRRYPEIEEINFLGSIESWIENPINPCSNYKLYINDKDCSTIEEIAIKQSISELHAGTFGEFRNLRKITIGKSIRYIEVSAFNYSLEEIIFENKGDLWEQTIYHPHPDSEPDHDRGWYTKETISFDNLTPRQIADYLTQRNYSMGKSKVCSLTKIEI